MPSLRERLTEMTEGSASREHLPRHLHVQEIEDIRRLYPHDIHVVEEGPKEFTHDWNFNCYFHTFGLHRDEEVKHEIKTNRRCWMHDSFVGYLLEEQFLQEVSQKEARDGDIAIYLEECTPPNPKHAGIIEGDLIISKWGTGHVWRHPLLEIPSIYGDRVKFFLRPSEDDIKRTFFKYVGIGR